MELLPDKVQFRVGPLEESLSERLKPTRSPHEQVRTMVRRYLWIMDESLPQLSEAEKNLIIDITNSTFFPNPRDMRFLWAELDDTREDFYEKWDVEKEDLVARAKEWSAAECAAVVDMTHRFWADHAKQTS